MAISAQRSQWDELHKESRRLENEVDLKLLSFSKLGSNFMHQRDGNTDIAVNGSGHVLDTMAMEISDLLSKLQTVNASLNEYVSSTSGSQPTATVYHTLQRHNEILQDYKQDFGRIKSNVVAQKQREELLGQAKKDYKTASGLNRRTELYLKEHEHIRSTDRLTEDAIGIAIETKNNLAHQRSTFAGATSKMTALTTKFPLMNSLVQKINLRKRRDSLILGGVIAVCIVVLLLFALR